MTTPTFIKDNYGAGDSWVALGTYKGKDGTPKFFAFPYKADVKSLVWYVPGELRGRGLRSAQDHGRAHGAVRQDRRRRRQAVVHRSRLGRRDRLARDRLGRGHDAAHPVAGRLRQVGDQRDHVQLARGRRRDRDLRHASPRTTPRSTAARRASPRPTSATARRASSRRRPSATCTARRRSSRPSSRKARSSARMPTSSTSRAYAAKPDLGKPVLGAGTLVTITKDSKAARAFIEFLKTPLAHEVWMAQSGFLTPLKGVNTDAYANDALKKQGEILANATTFRFDGSDLMPGKIGAGAFWTGMVDYVGGKSAAGRRSGHPEGLGRDQVSAAVLHGADTMTSGWHSPSGSPSHSFAERASMLEQLLCAVVTIVIGVGGCFGYFYGSNLLLDRHLSGACRRHVDRPHPQSQDPVRRSGHGCSSGPALDPADRLSHLSGVPDDLAVVPRQGGRRPSSASPTMPGLSTTRSSASRSSTICCGCSWCRPPAPSSA